MDLQELQKLLDSVKIGHVLLSECGEPRLEAFSENALYLGEDANYEQV